MSGHGSAKKGLATRAVQLLALATSFGVLFALTRFTPGIDSRLGTMTAIGFLVLAGTLLSELLEPLGLPHLTGYLLAGIVGGPHMLHLVDHHTVEQLSPVNTLALALIALAGGVELRIETLRSVAKSLAFASLIQTFVVLLGMGTMFLLLSRFIPFAKDLELRPLIGVALLWGALCVTRSPSACMGILSQTRAKGPLATFSLGFIMLSDVVVVMMVATAIMLARPLISAGAAISISDFNVLGHEILGSISMGTTLGLALAIYLRLVGGQLLLVLLALGFGVTAGLKYVHVDPLLTFLTAGFVVQNLSNQGPKLLHAVEQMGSVVFVLFFATAGAHLDVPLLKVAWATALTLCAARAGFTFLASRLSSRLASDPPVVRKWGWSSMVSQAGLALGLGVVVKNSFPGPIGDGFGSLVIAAVAINEMVGPVLFKMALDRTGETDRSEPAARPSIPPPAPVHP
ncbi:MAG TPA: cation:proton antiporter [Polyangiaceae bacterium]|nr:cation:proton antiporter [Polyangiaceae bacterium]